jgi:hypothetical protein
MFLIILFSLFIILFSCASLHEAVTMRRFPRETIKFPLIGIALLLLCIVFGAV